MRRSLLFIFLNVALLFSSFSFRALAMQSTPDGEAPFFVDSAHRSQLSKFISRIDNESTFTRKTPAAVNGDSSKLREQWTQMIAKNIVKFAQTLLAENLFWLHDHASNEHQPCWSWQEGDASLWINVLGVPINEFENVMKGCTDASCVKELVQLQHSFLSQSPVFDAVWAEAVALSKTIKGNTWNRWNNLYSRAISLLMGHMYERISNPDYLRPSGLPYMPNAPIESVRKWIKNGNCSVRISWIC